MASPTISHAPHAWASIGAAGKMFGLMRSAGVGEIVGCDREGAIYSGRGNMNSAKEWFANHTNSSRRMGTIGDVMKGADVFVGVSGPDLITAADVRSMAKNPIVFAMANPNPEIRPEQADGLWTPVGLHPAACRENPDAYPADKPSEVPLMSEWLKSDRLPGCQMRLETSVEIVSVLVNARTGRD